MRRPSMPRLRRGGAKHPGPPKPARARILSKLKPSATVPPLKLIVPVAVAILIVVLLIGTCGGNDDKQVRDTLNHFAQASRDKDYQALCDELLSSKLVQQLRTADQPCEVALRIGLSDVQNPTLEVRSVKVDGDKATAKVRSTAAGQPTGDATILLVREKDGWRISTPPQGPTPAAAP